MKEVIKRFKSPKFKAAFKDYLVGVGASAIAAALALAMDFAPEYAILIAGITAPVAAWADKNRKEYGRTK
jgi:hypothetical protein